ncbi:tRNA 2-thiouridine(34) synthase MnmA [Schlesneria paludicola]|uniref:tRNA 2-thiouridine(34) synthase MnmA n=1 Tax=Schlesneria paludicola TaxID=360056 RepID=UPI000299EADE|nr:tRNA 2-thiouridine(34) synthase MnmA [Schlesneria paludicola]
MRVVLAMSGGVDSSAAAVLLKQQGYDVIGLFMRSGAVEETACRVESTTNASPTGAAPATAAALPALPIISVKPNKQGCCSASDAADARRVADLLDIPFHALNFQDAFGRIKDYFVDEYLSGRTPNPCVMCNNWLKFGKLWDFAVSVGADRIATGHYAQIESFTGRPALVRGRDRSKDQSYVLAGINREILDRILFPVGGHNKPEIRELAAQAGLRVATKPDSQEICFIPDNDYVGFLERYRGRPDMSGDFVDPRGRVLGQHTGYDQFTIGQRRGLGITFGEPRFVIRIEPETRRVVLGTHDDLACRELEADGFSWLTDDVQGNFTALAQIRYQHTAATARIERQASDRVRVVFEEPQFGVAPGQALVLYDGDRVLGGGWIRQQPA